MSKKRVCILGSTGSIGRQALEVCENLSDEFSLVGLSCHNNTELLREQCEKFGVVYSSSKTQELPELIEKCEPDIVLNALVGFAGLECSYFALESGLRLALANKESLVVAGDILMTLSKKSGELLPVDSEHGAIFQCLIGEDPNTIKNLLVTASGGPFFSYDRERLSRVCAKDALAHPTWNMGAKITIDSATLMNKGLEVIEAHHLFACDYDKIKVVVQRQSVVHSMVEFVDGSTKAHLGPADMRIPIQYALTYPSRNFSPACDVDFTKIGSLDFAAADTSLFECLDIAYKVGECGGTLPCAMNAANEVANFAFREGRCGFFDIADCIKYTIEKTDRQDVESIEQLKIVDSLSRKLAVEYLESLD